MEYKYHKSVIKILYLISKDIDTFAAYFLLSKGGGLYVCEGGSGEFCSLTPQF